MDTVFYVPGVILLVSAVFKLSTMKESWRDPLMATSGSLLLIGAFVCILAAPPTIGIVNDLTGVANFSAPLVYSGMSALSAAYLVLMLTWRGGEPERVARASRLVVGVYGLVIVGIVVLFALADVPVERTRDLDTYYANTPYMREMILLYLVFHTVATAALAGMCLSWLRKVRDLTHRGLTLITVGALFDLSYQIAKYAAIGARWSGHDWDYLSTSVSPPLVAIAGVTVAAGFALPRLGPSAADNLRAWRRHRLLRPLWAEMRDLRTPTSDTHWWDPPVVRLVQQEITILDGVLVCSPYLDNEVRRSAYADARARVADAAGTTATVADQAEIVAEAAMLAVAKARVSADPGAGSPSDVGVLRCVERPHLMVGLAQALSSSPVVAACRRAALRGVPHD